MYENYGVGRLKPWLEKLVRINESGTILSLPQAGVSRTMAAVVEQLGWGNRLGVVDFLLEGEVRDEIEKLAEGGCQYILLKNVDGNGQKFEEYLGWLEAVRNQMGKKINYIWQLHTLPNLLVEHLERWAELFPVNTMYFPYSSGEELDILIGQNEERFGVEFSSKEKVRLGELSGGCPFLLKNICKRFGELGDLEMDDLAIDWGVSLLKQMDKRLVIAVKNQNKAREDIWHFCQQTGLLDQNGEVRSLIMVEALERIDLGIKVEVNPESGKLETSEGEELEQLTPAEMEVMQQIVRSRKISREEVAKLVYGETRAARVEEYSIDKIMSNLRLKLQSYGVEDFIKTRKGYGWGIEN
jgi:hypothetical protein